MHQPQDETAARYAAICDALLGQPGVSIGGERKSFGSESLRINHKIFAMVSSRGHFVVKLPWPRVEALVAAGEGERFDPEHGRLMKEWLALAPESHEDWLQLAREAMAFVSGGK